MIHTNTPITVANGDGIGPEITNAALCVLRDAGAHIHIDFVEIGLRAFNHGFPLGIPQYCMEIILRNKVLLKAPTITIDGANHSLPPLEGEQEYIFRPDVAALGIPNLPTLQCKVTYNAECIRFEPLCDALPDIADTNTANPFGMMAASALMLACIGQTQTAQDIGNGLLKTLEDGIHTADIYNPEYSRELSNTKDFTRAVIRRLGRVPEKITPFEWAELPSLPKELTK